MQKKKESGLRAIDQNLRLGFFKSTPYPDNLLIIFFSSNQMHVGVLFCKFIRHVVCFGTYVPWSPH